MFKVETEEGTYEVSFEYAFGKDDTRQSICLIKKADLSKVAIGVAICSPKDHFNKFVGRKIALGRALQNFPRPMRKSFWLSYFTTTKEGRKIAWAYDPKLEERLSSITAG